MTDVAYDIGLKPWCDADDFWEMTPAEFARTVEASRDREDREWDRVAWMVSLLMAPHTKSGKPIKLEKLLGRKIGSRRSKRAPSPPSEDDE